MEASEARELMRLREENVKRKMVRYLVGRYDVAVPRVQGAKYFTQLLQALRSPFSNEKNA